MSPRPVSAKVALAEQRLSSGFSSRSLRGFPGATLDPFLSIDHFRMSEPTFPPHPHAGFSAVTWLFEDSPGAFVNRDSLGDRSRIGPGALHWTQAASGMLHEEIPEVPGLVCHGLQIFVNLAAAHKRHPPRAFHADVLPLAAGQGWQARVLAGRVGDAVSPLADLLTPVLLLDLQLEAGARFSLPVEPDHTAFALVISGGVRAGPEEAELAAHAAAAFGDGDTVVLRADGPARVVVGGGRPLREPVFPGGPFVMNSREEVEAALERYRTGQMGRLDPTPTRWTALGR